MVDGEQTPSTPDRLSAAFIRLMHEDGGARSASQVAKAAGLNRSSFYAHFRDLDDLALSVLDTALTDIYQVHLAAGRRYPRDRESVRDATATAILQAVEEQWAALSAAVRRDRARARRQIGQAIDHNAREFLRVVPGWGDLDEAQARLLPTYLGFGWAGVICAWLAGEIVLERDDLVHELVALNPDGPRYLALLTDHTGHTSGPLLGPGSY